MKIGNITINRMDRQNQSLWLWLDAHVGRFWYVFSWRKGFRPYCYRSTDATPPCWGEYANNGRWLFGQRQYLFGE